MTCGHTAGAAKRIANTHQLQKVLLYHCHNEFTDERPNAHLPERRLKRELPDHVLSQGQFSRSLLTPVLHPDGEGRRARLIHLLLRLLPRRRGLDLLHCPRLRISFQVQ